MFLSHPCSSVACAYWECLNCTMPKHLVLVLGWRPKHPYLRTPWGRISIFGYLGWGCWNLFWPMACRGMGVWGASPKPKQFFFSIVQFEHPHPRYPKTPFLAHGVQRYGCLGCHPRTQTIFFGMVQSKHGHPRYPKTAFLARSVQTCGWSVLL